MDCGADLAGFNGFGTGPESGFNGFSGFGGADLVDLGTDFVRKGTLGPHKFNPRNLKVRVSNPKIQFW